MTKHLSVKLDSRVRDVLEQVRGEFPHLTQRAMVEAMVLTCARLLRENEAMQLDRPAWAEQESEG